MTLLLLHAGATLAMTGLIWFVQVVHYPLFGLASERRFARFSAEHRSRTSLVVGPLMLGEAATALALVVVAAPGRDSGLAWAGALLLLLIWLSTALVQIPLHGRLDAARDPAVIRRLVRTNWLRTAAWSARSVVALMLLA